MSNITEINKNNYNNSELLNSYHSDIAKFRINDLDFPEELRNRDQFFLNVENFKYGEWNEYYNNNLKDIRSKIDVFSNAYEQVSNVERIMNRLDNLKHIDLEDYNISLTNANLKEDNSVKLQLTNAQEKYVIDSNDLNKVLNEDILSKYDYEEEINIVDQIQNNITQDKDYQPNVNIHKNEINDQISNNKTEETKIQKLKSVELEKGVIGLLPKEQQENNYKETISRLEKNKLTLKDDLKSYMSNTKIDNAINSVKQHFENVKVKAEDIHKTFKDLGQWNTDNKLVKNIDDVIKKVKELPQKKENKIDLNDDNSLSKIEQKIKQSNEFIENVSIQKNKENQLRDNKINYLQQTLEIKNPKMLKESNSIENGIKDLSKSEKITLYNNAKDISSLNNNKIVSEDNQLNTILKAEKLSKVIENDIGTNEINQFRKDYLTSSTKKPAELNLENNEQLKMYSNQANYMIKNTNRDDLKNYQSNSNNEINSINNNQKANSLKNNELIKKFNKSNQLTNNEQQSNNLEKEQEQLDKSKKANAQVR